MKSDRLQEIKKLFLNRKKVTNPELCETFGVSIETVRRDLNILEKEGFIRKIYGGACLNEAQDIPAPVDKWTTRIDRNEAFKRSIAAAAAARIPDGATVFLDAGTTVYEIAPHLTGKKNLTVLTNSLRLASALGMYEHITVYCIGGLIKTDTLCSSGFFAAELLSYFCRIDFAVISCDGFIPDKGTTEYSIELSMLKKIVLEKADRIIAVVDHGKFGISGSCLCCPTERIDILVTDTLAPQEVLDTISDFKGEVAISDPIHPPVRV